MSRMGLQRATTDIQIPQHNGFHTRSLEDAVQVFHRIPRETVADGQDAHALGRDSRRAGHIDGERCHLARLEGFPRREGRTGLIGSACRYHLDLQGFAAHINRFGRKKDILRRGGLEGDRSDGITPEFN